MNRRDTARRRSDLRGTVFVWSRYIADRADARLCHVIRPRNRDERLAARLFHARLPYVQFSRSASPSVAGLQIAAGTFAAVQSFYRFALPALRGLHVRSLPAQGLDATALHRQHPALCAAPALARHRADPHHAVHERADRSQAYRVRCTCRSQSLVALGIFISFGTGGTFALVPLLFPDRPGVAAGFIGGVSTAGGIVYPLIFAAEREHPHGLSLCRPLYVRSLRALLSVGGTLRTPSRGARPAYAGARRRKSLRLWRSTV